MATNRSTKPAGKTRSRGGSKTASGAMRKRSRRAVVEHVEAVLDTHDMLKKPLQNAQHERFCLAVLSEPSITAAAIKAGYAAGSARQQGSRLLTNADIQRRLAYLLSESAATGILGRQAVLRNASSRAAAAITDFADLLRLPWSAFCEAVKHHPAARGIKRVKRGVEYDASSKTWSEPYVEEIELFDPRSSERLLADILGWDAPKQVAISPGAGEDENGAPRGIIYLPVPFDAPRGELPGGDAEG